MYPQGGMEENITKPRLLVQLTFASLLLVSWLCRLMFSQSLLLSHPSEEPGYKCGRKSLPVYIQSIHCSQLLANL